MQWLLRLLLLGPLLEARALASQAKFHHFRSWWHVLAALANDSLHVAALGADQTARHLELFLIGDLDIVATGVLGLSVAVAVAVGIRLLPLGLLLLRLVVWNQTSIHGSTQGPINGPIHGGPAGRNEVCRVLVLRELLTYVLHLKFGPSRLELTH